MTFETFKELIEAGCSIGNGVHSGIKEGDGKYFHQCYEPGCCDGYDETVEELFDFLSGMPSERANDPDLKIVYDPRTP